MQQLRSYESMLKNAVIENQHIKNCIFISHKIYENKLTDEKSIVET